MQSEKTCPFPERGTKQRKGYMQRKEWKNSGLFNLNCGIVFQSAFWKKIYYCMRIVQCDLLPDAVADPPPHGRQQSGPHPPLHATFSSQHALDLLLLKGTSQGEEQGVWTCELPFAWHFLVWKAAVATVLPLNVLLPSVMLPSRERERQERGGLKQVFDSSTC